MNNNKSIRIVVILILSYIFVGCKSKLDIIKENSNADFRYNKAVEYFNAGREIAQNKKAGSYKYFIASKELFESVKDAYKASSKSEEMLYGWANATYYAGSDLFTARMLYKTLASEFPNGKYAEEANYMIVKCLYEESPSDYTLDQSTTYEAINAINWFFSLYPNSKYAEECNNLMSNLDERLKKKSFEDAKLFFTIRKYPAAIVALNNALKEYPDTKYRETIEFLIIKSKYIYATNSHANKQRERFISTLESCKEFIEKYPLNKNIKAVEEIREISNQNIISS
ncbi:MAG: outer membrane protein assembly factor BamD [Solitalea-like symbiont of Acarus siro]